MWDEYKRDVQGIQVNFLKFFFYFHKSVCLFLHRNWLCCLFLSMNSSPQVNKKLLKSEKRVASVLLFTRTILNIKNMFLTLFFIHWALPRTESCLEECSLMLKALLHSWNKYKSYLDFFMLHRKKTESTWMLFRERESIIKNLILNCSVFFIDILVYLNRNLKLLHSKWWEILVTIQYSRPFGNDSFFFLYNVILAFLPPFFSQFFNDS